MRFKDGAWRLTASLDGRRHYRTVKAPDNRTGRAEANRQLAQLVTELGQGRHLGDRNTTFADLATEWLAHHGPNLEAGTRDSYRLDLARALPDLGDTPLHRLGPRDLDRLYRRLTDKGLAPKTVRNVHGTIHAALGHAVRWGWVDRNPADRADPPVAKRKAINVPTPHQVLAAIDHARPDFAVMVRTAATTGHRKGTLLALRWTDVDLDAGTVTFARAIANAEGHLIEKGTKADRTDTVTLGADTGQALRDHRRACAERAMAATDLTLPPNGFVWAQDVAGERPWHPGGATQRWRATCKRAEITGVRFHDLKHFAVTQMLTAGIPPHVVAQRVGTSLQTILRVYAHYLPGADQGAAEVMDRLLG